MPIPSALGCECKSLSSCQSYHKQLFWIFVELPAKNFFPISCKCALTTPRARDWCLRASCSDYMRKWTSTLLSIRRPTREHFFKSDYNNCRHFSNVSISIPVLTYTSITDPSRAPAPLIRSVIYHNSIRFFPNTNVVMAQWKFCFPPLVRCANEFVLTLI